MEILNEGYQGIELQLDQVKKIKAMKRMMGYETNIPNFWSYYTIIKQLK